MTREQDLLGFIIGADLLPDLLRTRAWKQIPRFHDVLAAQNFGRDRRGLLSAPERTGENQIRRNLRFPRDLQYVFQVPLALGGELPVAVREPGLPFFGVSVAQNINVHVTSSRPPRAARLSIALSPAVRSASSSTLGTPPPVRQKDAAPQRPRPGPGGSSRAWWRNR